jgi:uncharacterized protein
VLERVLPLLGSFQDQVVLVTGASSGIGRETALTFARQGAAVALVARRVPQLEEVARAVKAAGARALVLPTDVTDQRAVRATVARVRRAWGRIDLLVNSAGTVVPGPVAHLRAKDLEAMMLVNVYGALFMMQAALPVMRAQRRGTIINIASLAGRRGLTPLGGYSATKFALVGLTEALRTEPEVQGIHIGLVLPGIVDTPMAQRLHRDTRIPGWPSMFDMPSEWVVAAILLAVRFRLREISVPPGAATLEIVAELAPGIGDALIRWASTAGRLLTRRTPRRSTRSPDRREGRRRTREAH